MVERKNISEIGWEIGPLRALRRHLNLTTPEFVTVEEFDEEEFKEVHIKICENISKELLMSTDLDPDLYGDPDVKNSMENIPDSVEKNILLDKNVDVDERLQDSNTSWIFDLENTTFKHSIENVPHWLISDGNDIRLEKPHGSTEKGAPYLILRDLNTTVVDLTEQRFRTWWDDAEDVDC